MWPGANCFVCALFSPLQNGNSSPCLSLRGVVRICVLNSVRGWLAILKRAVDMPKSDLSAFLWDLGLNSFICGWEAFSPAQLSKIALWHLYLTFYLAVIKRNYQEIFSSRMSSLCKHGDTYLHEEPCHAQSMHIEKRYICRQRKTINNHKLFCWIVIG